MPVPVRGYGLELYDAPRPTEGSYGVLVHYVPPVSSALRVVACVPFTLRAFEPLGSHQPDKSNLSGLAPLKRRISGTLWRCPALLGVVLFSFFARSCSLGKMPLARC